MTSTGHSRSPAIGNVGRLDNSKTPLQNNIVTDALARKPSPSRHHLSYGDCLGDKRENYHTTQWCHSCSL